MKTFTQISKFREGSYGANRNGRMINVIWEDPKREGLYTLTKFQVCAGEKTRRYCELYGKCNQERIIALTKDFYEV